MIKNLIISTSVLVLALVSFPFLVIAQENEDSDSLQEVTQTSLDETVEQRSNERGQEESAQDRINRIKNNSADKITAAEERRIEARCSNAQNRIQQLQTRQNAAIENRQELYLRVSSRLTEIVQKLQAANVDTTELEVAVDEMTSTITESLNFIEEYTQSLADISDMDCAADPQGFKALLDNSRKNRVEILSGYSEIQVVKNEKVKPILQSIRESLSPESVNEEIEE